MLFVPMDEPPTHAATTRTITRHVCGFYICWWKIQKSAVPANRNLMRHQAKAACEAALSARVSEVKDGVSVFWSTRSILK